MPIYIVRPRSSNVQSLGLATRSLSRQRRPDQIHQVQELRKTDPAGKEVSTIVKDYSGKVVHGGSKTPITGVQLVEMSPAQAERMRQQNRQVVVLRDQPMNLIDPKRVTGAGVKSTISGADLWHLVEIGLSQSVRPKLAVSGQGVTVAVLDTGIQADHPELANNRVAGATRFDTKKWKSLDQAKSVDTSGHGTHVAGLICGKAVGVAPGAKVWNAMMIPHGHGNLSDFILALEWAGQQPEIQIVNVSAGIPNWIDGMQEVLGDLLMAGVLPVIAVGNEGPNTSRSPGNYVEAFSVGASNNQHKVASWSCGGQLKPETHIYTVPDLVAPGQQVTSCVMTGGYEAWSGSSMATPIVSGVAALVLEKYQHTDLTVTDLQDMLLECCRDLGAPVERQGRGLVQVPTELLPAKPTKPKKTKKKAAKPPKKSAKPKAGS